MTETQNTSRRPGALIAMSGGVDSSVAAWLMQRDGFDCTGVTMRLTRNEAVNTEGLHTCCSERDIEDAAEVAYAMDIPYLSLIHISVMGLRVPGFSRGAGLFFISPRTLYHKNFERKKRSRTTT